ncbi:MAG: hypothetical protein ACKOZZ_03560, partial [Bacteroidota bacterium]
MKGVMKGSILFLFFSMISIIGFSQAPELISYQTIIRNSNNELVANVPVGVRISILSGSAADILWYQEEHKISTNLNGLAYLNIGSGTLLFGTMSGIDWSKGPFYIKSETDPTGGKNYTLVVVSRLLSVPYSIYAKTAEKLTGPLTELDPLFNASISKGITAVDTAYWNDKLDNFTETDPLYNASVAKGITSVDTAGWNQKVGLPQTGNTAGDMLYWNGTAWVKIQQGLPGQGLFLSQTGIPVWAGPAFATLTTNVATSVTNIAAISGGNISSDGGTPVTARGICWSTSPNPTVANDSTNNGTGSGVFTANISGLLGNTTYYVRAYAINSSGIAYGNQITFITLAPTAPNVTTTNISSVTSVGGATGGTILNNGGAPVTASGVVWDTLTNPDLTKNKSINGSVSGIFLDTIKGLTGSKTYYVRAYATNNAGTAYGASLSFTTLPPVVPTVSINPIDTITNISARSGGIITSDGGASILSKGVCWSTTPNPTISNAKTMDGSGLSSFISQLTGLLGDSTYYVRAYATNATGTAY